MKELWLFLTKQMDLCCLGLLIPLLFARWIFVSTDRKRTEWLLVCAIWMVPFGFIGTGLLKASALLSPWRYDLYVFQLDKWFGEPSFWVSRHVRSHRWLIYLVNMVYTSIIASIFVTLGVVLWKQSIQDAIRVLKTFLSNTLIAIGLFCMVPVNGPIFVFEDFPKLPSGKIIPHAIAGTSVYPNGIPSVHMSTAFLVWWFLGRWRWGSVVGGVWVILTAFATLAEGQHYLVDLICAIPYTAGILWLMGAKRPIRIEEPEKMLV